MTQDWAASFERAFAVPASEVDRRIWREVFGDEYPEGLDTCSYVSRTELVQFQRELRVRTGDLLLDVGCGRGGPALWTATHTGAHLIGIDIARSAAADAASRAADLGVNHRAAFVCATFDRLPLATAAVDAVMSIDALLFAPDKQASLDELARVLRPGGRLVFTSWDHHSQPRGRPVQVDDHRPLLDRAGFAVLVYEETADWRERQRRTDELSLAAVEELAAEAGDDPVRLRAELEEAAASDATMVRRVLAVAERV